MTVDRPVSATELARIQRLYARRKTRALLTFTLCVWIAIAGILAGIAGFKRLEWFIIPGIAIASLGGLAQGVYWRCPRCHNALPLRGWPGSGRHCPACDVELEPPPEQSV